jgi:hypothetical protein
MNIRRFSFVLATIALATSATAQTFTPTRGQSQHRQDVDDTTCTGRAARQTGFDPGMAPPPPAPPKKDPQASQRAAFAKVRVKCMEGLGYTVK